MAKGTPVKITEKEVLKAQKQWGDAIVDIGNAFTSGQDVVKCAKNYIANLYDYKNGTVLFKPTKCEVRQFRLTPEGALSYFVGNEFVKSGFPEDQGFAIAPYISVDFLNAGIILDGNRATAMGNYYFRQPDGKTVQVEYTFGYIKRKSVVINLHHSSIPYSTAE
ncbi:MAG: hypothetical protein AAF939_01755 [Planctomycetota bacterium]